ncbi:MAG: class I SAM-dependent methyltransferase [Desulfocapsaceae bacterium]|nr:class I SAM-dependent methyltransferase [Desulfocapsaceae bacterium]
MADFTFDLPFYLSTLAPESEILELGCGSGRLTRALATRGHRITGIDNSAEMLDRAASQDTRNISYICMDMNEILLPGRFNAVIVPYNTFTLLESPATVARCLKRIRGHLKEGGRLLLQIFTANPASFPSTGARTFQFQIFTTADGGKIIKETLKHYREEEQVIMLNERYRVRPAGSLRKNEDLAHSMRLLALPYSQWAELLIEAGFTIVSEYGDYDLSSFVQSRDSRLLLAARTA